LVEAPRLVVGPGEASGEWGQVARTRGERCETGRVVLQVRPVVCASGAVANWAADVLMSTFHETNATGHTRQKWEGSTTVTVVHYLSFGEIPWFDEKVEIRRCDWS